MNTRQNYLALFECIHRGKAIGVGPQALCFVAENSIDADECAEQIVRAMNAASGFDCWEILSIEPVGNYI